MPPFFEYITSNIDSDDVMGTDRDVTTIECCNCEGFCNDVNTCSCIRNQRHYTDSGVAIPGIKNQIFECNMRCSCSVRRCTNRVVERGPIFPLQIFRPGNFQVSYTIFFIIILFLKIVIMINLSISGECAVIK
jgi:hypothetical protein